MPNEFNIKNGFISNNNSIVQGGFTATTISSTTITTSFSSGSTLFAGTSGQISQNNSQFFWDNVNNRLGVGTNAPSSKLHIVGGTTNGAAIITGGASGNDVNFGGNLWLGSDTFYKGSFLYSYDSKLLTINGGDVIGAIAFKAATNERMRIFSTGNVGINTTTDAGFLLDVNGTTRVSGVLTTTADAVVNGISVGAGGGSVSTNVRFGNSAGQSNTSGSTNSFIGTSAGQNNTTGNNNSFFGSSAGVNNTIGVENSFFGVASGLNNTTGSFNLFLGRNAGRFTSNGISANTISNNSIFLGNSTRANASGETNQIVIGDSAIGLGSNKTVLGNSSTTTTAIYGNLLLGTTVDSGYKLDVSGGTRVVGTKGSVITSGSSTTAFITVSGSSTVGGTGYTDFIQVTNTAAGATNINKTIRLNNTGAIDFINSAYNATIFSITDVGAVGVGLATTTSSDATSNYLSFGNNNTQIYDDGNTHIHSRGANQAMWINTNNGQINIGVQSPVAGGAIASAIAFGTGIANGYVTINTGRTVTTSAAYGYLTTGGAGTYPGGSQSVVISLYANSRIWGQEIDAFSDERMKDIEGDITLEDGLKLVNNLKPIKYRWKKGDDKGIKAGYSAQQVIKSGFDHLVSIIPNEGLEETIDEDGFMSPKDTQFSMNYDQVTPYHGVVIKHLLEQIELLKEEIQELKNK